MPARVRLVLLASACAAGCSFFEELGDAPWADTDTDTDGADEDDGDLDVDGGSVSAETGAEPCTIERDDLCVDQDTLHSCDPQTGELTVMDCAAACGNNLNFTCLGTPSGQHACWCVVPGKQKVLSCGELEACLQGCTNAVGTACADGCFSRTTEAAIRIYGALVWCAHASCRDACLEEAYACATCIASGIQNGTGGCGLERSVCDTDQNDEPG